MYSPNPPTMPPTIAPMGTELVASVGGATALPGTGRVVGEAVCRAGRGRQGCSNPWAAAPTLPTRHTCCPGHHRRKHVACRHGSEAICMFQLAHTRTAQATRSLERKRAAGGCLAAPLAAARNASGRKGAGFVGAAGIGAFIKVGAAVIGVDGQRATLGRQCARAGRQRPVLQGRGTGWLLHRSPMV